MSRPPGKPRGPQLLLAWLVMATLFAIPAVITSSGPATAGQAARNLLPASEEYTQRDPDWKGEIFGTLPAMPEDCGSKNITGQFGPSRWTVRSSIGKGSTVWVGDEWTVEFSIGQTYAGGPYGNNGPDPLNLELKPTGPVEPAAAPQGESGELVNVFAYDGDGSTGLHTAIGAWGYSFDSNSSPGVARFSDGADVKVIVKMKATAEGVISLPKIHVSGWDETTPSGPVSCDLNVGWSWTVAGPLSPKGLSDNAIVNATYGFDGTIDDQSAGSHRIEIPVLANDDDPNTAGGVGDLDQLGISDWSALSKYGGQVLCGPIKGAASSVPVADLGKRCEYQPKQGFSGVDTFFYKLRQDTDHLEKLVPVTVNVLPNQPPSAPDAAFGTVTNTDDSFDLAPLIADPQGDPVICLQNLPDGPTPANAGWVTVHDDCSVDWDNQNPGFTGPVTFTYRTCDVHPTLAMADMGPGVKKMAGFSTGDLSGQATQRCRDAEATITVNAGLTIPPFGVTDVDVVDAGYAGDAIGPYTLSIPVLANDFDANGPKPTQPSAGLAILDAPDPGQGTATVVGSNVEFTPADGYAGPVELTYRVCEDPDTQAPPYEGFGYCGAGVVSIEVLGNDAPATEPDNYLVVQTNELIDENVGDNDADDDVLFCTQTPVSVSAPEKVEHLEIGFDCDFSFDPVNSATGPVTIGYEVCDAHLLANPAHPDSPYGADGRDPGELARRCSVETITVTIIPLLVIDPPDEEDPWEDDPAPVCVDDEAQTPFGTDVEIDVLLNDSDVDLDEQDAPVHLPGPTGDDPGETEHGGSFQLDGDGTALVYTPADGFSGVDTFTYVAQDGIGKGCEATVTVTVADEEVDPTDPDPVDPDPSDPDPSDPGSTTTTTAPGPTTTVAGDGLDDDTDPAGTADGATGAAAASTAGATTSATGSLPVTGGNVIALAGAGLALVGGGAVLLAARRRRT